MDSPEVRTAIVEPRKQTARTTCKLAHLFSVFVDDKTAADAFVKYLEVSRTKL